MVLLCLYMVMLEYTSIVWDNCTQELSDLEGVQYRAGKIICRAIHCTSQELVYNELGWAKFNERRKNKG